MRLLGAAGSVILLGALILVGIGLFGGPDTPFSVFGAPHAHSQGNPGDSKSRLHSGRSTPGQPGSGPSSSRSPSPRPRLSGSRSPSGTPTSASTSPAPTNSAGKTPPGQTKSPPPHPSPSSTHAK